MKSKYITVNDIARKLGITPRAVHFKLKKGEAIPHVKSYEKVGTGRTCAYIIEALPSFFKDQAKKDYDGLEDFLK